MPCSGRFRSNTWLRAAAAESVSDPAPSTAVLANPRAPLTSVGCVVIEPLTEMPPTVMVFVARIRPPPA